MDRVVLGGCLMLLALGVLIGAGVSAEQSPWKMIRDGMELLSFAGTAITGVVAIVALTSWQRQFRHTEKFKSLKDLQAASVDLFQLVVYLDSVFQNCWTYVENGSPNEQARAEEQENRQKWFASLTAYLRAWSSAVVFLTDEEISDFLGGPEIFESKAREYALKLHSARINIPANERYGNLLSVADEVTSCARELYRSTTEQIAEMLVRHAVR